MERDNLLPYQELANGIIYQASLDYRKQFLAHIKSGKTDAEADWRLRELREFFKSDWCQVLTNLDGVTLMQKLEEDVLRKHNRKEASDENNQNQISSGHSED